MTKFTPFYSDSNLIWCSNMTGTLIILQPEHSSTDSRPGTRGTPPWSEMIKRQKLKFLITAPPVSQVECHVPAINMVTFLADTRTPSLPPQIRNPIISISAVLCQCASVLVSTAVDIISLLSTAVQCSAVSSGKEMVEKYRNICI